MNKERPSINLFFILIPAIISSILTSNSYITVIPSCLLIIFSYFNNFHFPRNSFNSTLSCLMIFGVSILLHVFVITDLPTGNGPHIMAASMIVLMVYLWYYQNPKITTPLIVLLCLLVMIFTGNNINESNSKYPIIVSLSIPMFVIYLFFINGFLKTKKIFLLIISIFTISISSLLLNKLLFFADDKINLFLQDMIQNIDYSDKQGFSNELEIKNQVNLKLSKKPVILFKGKKVQYLRAEILVHYSRKSWSSVQKSFGEAKTLDFDNKKLMTYNQETLNEVISKKNNLSIGTINFLDSTKTPALPINTYLFSNGIYKVKPYNILGSSNNINYLEIYTLNNRELNNEIYNDEFEIDKLIKNSLINLSHKITENDKDDLSKAQSILNYLQNYNYSLKVDFAQDKEPIIDFIFNKKSGFCLHFASAMTLMLRSINVPAHIVSGYIVNEYSSNLDSYVIRERDAHAWVEVFDRKSKVWKTFDPTPSGQMKEYMNSRESIFEQVYLYSKVFIIKIKSFFSIFSLVNIQKVGTSPYSLFILILGTFFIVFRNYKFKPKTNDINKETKYFLNKILKILKKYNVEFKDNMTYNELIELLTINNEIPINTKETLINDINEFQLRRYKKIN
jgi:transglutaminase-like putative cysteine protease